MTAKFTAEINITVEEGRVLLNVTSDTSPEDSPATALAVLMVTETEAKLNRISEAFSYAMESSIHEAAKAISKAMQEGRHG